MMAPKLLPGFLGPILSSVLLLAALCALAGCRSMTQAREAVIAKEEEERKKAADEKARAAREAEERKAAELRRREERSRLRNEAAQLVSVGDSARALEVTEQIFNPPPEVQKDTVTGKEV